MDRSGLRRLLLLTVSLVVATPATAGVHLWRVNELFSNPDGTIQFIELYACCGSTGEFYVGGHAVTSNSKSYTIPSNVGGPSTFEKTILLGTAAFAALPGAPPVDHVIVPNFFSTTADTITFIDAMSFGTGQLPTDGITSLAPGGVTAVNSPRNYAEQTGSVNAAPLPPVPDGGPGESPVTVSKLDDSGTDLSVAFDATSCATTDFRNVLYGELTGFPSAGTPTFTLAGAACGIGSSPPYSWIGSPVATDGSGLVWFVVVTSDGSKEGSWGRSTGGAEPAGPGTNGASNLCGSFDKSVVNGCGQ